jgi:putative SOS response-associated peptidase YedK
MCNLYEQMIAWDQYCQMMQELEWNIPNQQTDLDLRQAAEVRISDVAPVMRAAAAPAGIPPLPGDVVELAPMAFAWPPAGRGGPVFNFRSEGRDFSKSLRCLIPASAFFEFKGAKSPKAKYRFTLKDAPFLAIAALWKPGEGNQPAAFTMLTTEPGPDVAPIHKRQVLVLRPERWKDWIYLRKPQAELLKPLPAGSLKVELVRPGSDPSAVPEGQLL